MQRRRVAPARRRPWTLTRLPARLDGPGTAPQRPPGSGGGRGVGAAHRLSPVALDSAARCSTSRLDNSFGVAHSAHSRDDDDD